MARALVLGFVVLLLAAATRVVARVAAVGAASACGRGTTNTSRSLREVSRGRIEHNVFCGGFSARPALLLQRLLQTFSAQNDNRAYFTEQLPNICKDNTSSYRFVAIMRLFPETTTSASFKILF